MFAAGPTWRTIVCFGDQRTDGSSTINFTLHYVQRESESAFKSSVPCVSVRLKKGRQAQGPTFSTSYLLSIGRPAVWFLSLALLALCPKSARIPQRPILRVQKVVFWRGTLGTQRGSTTFARWRLARVSAHPRGDTRTSHTAKLSPPRAAPNLTCNSTLSARYIKSSLDAPRDAKSEPSRVPS
jgi:hypothetical protein